MGAIPSNIAATDASGTGLPDLDPPCGDAEAGTRGCEPMDASVLALRSVSIGGITRPV